MHRLKVALRAAKTLARDPRIPRPVRWLLLASALPIPGPVDEAIGLLVLAVIALFWRPVLRDAVKQAREHQPKS